MPTLAPAAVADSLADLPRLLQAAEGFEPLAEACTAAAARSSALGVGGRPGGRGPGPRRPGRYSSSSPTRGDLDAWAARPASFCRQPPAIFPAWDSLPGTAALRRRPGQRLRLLQHSPSYGL